MAKFEPYKTKITEEIIEADQKWDAFFSLPSTVEVEGTDASLYPDLSFEALLTSYQDYYQILNDCDSALCDLGAGIGRGTFLSTLLDGPPCFSIELSEDRVRQSQASAKRLGIESDYFERGSITDVDIARFDNYYLYFPVNSALMYFMSKLLEQSLPKTVYVTESHGLMIDLFENMGCFDLIGEFECSLPRHNKHIKKFHLNSKRTDISKLLQNWNKDFVFVYRYDHLILKKQVEWKFSNKDCVLFFENEFKIEFLPFKRVLKLKDLIVENENSLPHLSEPVKTLYVENSIFLEYKNGRVVKYN